MQWACLQPEWLARKHCVADGSHNQPSASSMSQNSQPDNCALCIACRLQRGESQFAHAAVCLWCAGMAFQDAEFTYISSHLQPPTST